MTINTRIWENSLAGLPEGDPEAEQFEHYAREFFIPDNIAPAAYLANVAVLMHQPSEGSDVPPSPSMATVTANPTPAQGFPAWFLAAYPDVALWFSSRSGDERRAVDTEVAARAAVTAGKRLLDDQGFYGHAVLRALVDLYRQQNGGVLECMAGTADLQEEEAAGPAAEQAMTAQEAVDLMAANITRYERELATSYGDRFPDMRPRLTVAGLLQLGYYVLVDHSIPLAALVRAADEAVSADDPVVEYVEKLEVEVFCAEGGEKERKRVEDACHLLRSRILDVVLQTRADFDAAPSLSQATRNFMEESEFEPLRQVVGIRPAG